MSRSIPFTRCEVPLARQEGIRQRVREAWQMGASRIARPEDAHGLFALLSDPAVHAPIYTLPRPLSEASVAAFVARHAEEQARGEGILFLRVEDGAVMGYSDVQIWPEWAAGELGGALHPSLHARGMGGRGAAESFFWMFETLDLDLICETASLENVPTQRMLDAMGFVRKGSVESVRPDGTTRQSLVWEMTREDWQARQGRAQT